MQIIRNGSHVIVVLDGKEVIGTIVSSFMQDDSLTYEIRLEDGSSILTEYTNVKA